VAANIFTSAPAEKNFSEALRTTMDLTAAVNRAWSIAAERSSQERLVVGVGRGPIQHDVPDGIPDLQSYDAHDHLPPDSRVSGTI